MSRLLILIISVCLCFAQSRPEEHTSDVEILLQNTQDVMTDRVPIDSIGGWSIAGPGKSITVCEHGDVIAVIYGAPTGDWNNPMKVKVAYSTDTGATWIKYGPFSGNCRGAYNAVDGAPDFNSVAGHLYFCWQENTLGYNDGALKVMIEENVPSSPSFSVPVTMPNGAAPAIYPWEPDIAVAPDDPSNLVATGWSYLAGGNNWAYCWISADGGYTWTDSIPMAYISPDGAVGNIACGNNGYVVYGYLDYYSYTPTDSIPYPYYIESTDGGHTWCPETPVPGVPVNPGSQFWWDKFDCLVINNEPWLIYNDIGSPGGGPYILHGVGVPGNWTWEVYDAGQLGACSLTVADTIFYCYPSQYPSMAHDPISNTILGGYKAFFYKEYDGTVYYNGAHIGGLYTTDNGATWTISQPLSEPNTGQIPWEDWDYTEMAYRLVNTNGDIWAYSIWVHGSNGTLYFERGLVTSFLPLAILESSWDGMPRIPIRVDPSIGKARSNIEFSMLCPGNLQIDLYNVAGRFIKTLFQGRLQAGDHTIPLSTNELPVGVYYVVLITPSDKAAAKIVVMR